MSFLKKISAGLKKTTEQFSGGIDNVFQSSKIPEETISDLEDFMISSDIGCLLYTSPSPRDGLLSRMPSSA